MFKVLALYPVELALMDCQLQVDESQFWSLSPSCHVTCLRLSAITDSASASPANSFFCRFLALVYYSQMVSSACMHCLKLSNTQRYHSALSPQCSVLFTLLGLADKLLSYEVACMPMNCISIAMRFNAFRTPCRESVSLASSW
eukprot:6117113-Amphidinium_carterae.1